MDSENLYPNDGEFFSPFKSADGKTARTVIPGRKIVKEAVARLEERIAATDSVKQVLIIAEQYDVSREAALVISDIVRTQLEIERSLLQAVLDAK